MVHSQVYLNKYVASVAAAIRIQSLEVRVVMHASLRIVAMLFSGTFHTSNMKHYMKHYM